MNNRFFQNFFVFLMLIFIFNSNVFAEVVDVTSDKYILYNMNETEILSEKNSHEKAYVASLTKIMTVLVAIENIDDYTQKVTITNDMLKNIEWDVSVVGFKVGQTVTYDDLLYGTMLESGADAVNGLAYSISGNEKKFVELMNLKATEIGLSETHFANPVGLFDINNYSSASDMAKLLIYALKNEKFKEIFTSKEYNYSIGGKASSTLSKYNKKSGFDISNITGSKTGYISAAGYCLASTATINNVDYLLITLNAMNGVSTSHIKDSLNIYNYYADNYEYKNIVDYNDIITTIKVKGSKERKIDVKSSAKIEDYLSKNFDKNDLKYVYDGVDEITIFTPVKTELGNVKIMYNDKVLDSFKLIYNEKAHFGFWGFIWDYKFILLFLIFILYCFLRVCKVKKIRVRIKRKNMSR
jgi:serine-type D-Ala-D-Ala carboxypeptidase (penicillin-binding protein 5/6)